MEVRFLELEVLHDVFQRDTLADIPAKSRGKSISDRIQGALDGIKRRPLCFTTPSTGRVLDGQRGRLRGGFAAETNHALRRDSDVKEPAQDVIESVIGIANNKDLLPCIVVNCLG